jgi:nitric oxide reductase subunit B
VERQAALRGMLQQTDRSNTYDSSTGTLRIDPVRAPAHSRPASRISATVYERECVICDPAAQRHFAAFMFWTAWSATANRNGDKVSYNHKNCSLESLGLT